MWVRNGLQRRFILVDEQAAPVQKRLLQFTQHDGHKTGCYRYARWTDSICSNVALARTKTSRFCMLHGNEGRVGPLKLRPESEGGRNPNV